MKLKIFFSLCLLCLLGACGKLELPTNDGAEDGSGEGEETERPVPSPDSDTLSVAQFRHELEHGKTAWIKGYIVGYIPGNSIKQSVFDVPLNEVNTNMLLADSPNETDYANCIPVKLANTGTYAVRSQLNLYDHPEYLGQYIALMGLKWEYFRTTGITEVYDYCWPAMPAVVEKSTPILVHEEEYIPEGR